MKVQLKRKYLENQERKWKRKKGKQKKSLAEEEKKKERKKKINKEEELKKEEEYEKEEEKDEDEMTRYAWANWLLLRHAIFVTARERREPDLIFWLADTGPGPRKEAKSDFELVLESRESDDVDVGEGLGRWLMSARSDPPL